MSHSTGSVLPSGNAPRPVISPLLRPLAPLASLVACGACSKEKGEPLEQHPPPSPSTWTLPENVAPATTVGVPWLPPTISHWHADLERVAAEYRVDPELLAIVVLVESGGDPVAKSPSGALGLMQILPLTGRHIATERGLRDHKNDRLTDPAYNIDFGAWYLSHQLDAFAVKDDPARSIELAAAAYNAGPGRLAKHLKGGVTLTSETQRYMRWVGGMWKERREARSETYATWWKAGGSKLVERAASALNVVVVPPS